MSRSNLPPSCLSNIGARFGFLGGIQLTSTVSSPLGAVLSTSPPYSFAGSFFAEPFIRTFWTAFVRICFFRSPCCLSLRNVLSFLMLSSPSLQVNSSPYASQRSPSFHFRALFLFMSLITPMLVPPSFFPQVDNNVSLRHRHAGVYPMYWYNFGSSADGRRANCFFCGLPFGSTHHPALAVQ